MTTETTADVGGDLQLPSSDTYPDPRFYEKSVADLLAEHRPFVPAFYSAAFWPTPVCGRFLRNLKLIASEFPDVRFVHVEPYVMQNLGGRVQPATCEGKLQWAPWSVACGISREPQGVRRGRPGPGQRELRAHCRGGRAPGGHPLGERRVGRAPDRDRRRVPLGRTQGTLRTQFKRT